MIPTVAAVAILLGAALVRRARVARHAGRAVPRHQPRSGRVPRPVAERLAAAALPGAPGTWWALWRVAVAVTVPAALLVVGPGGAVVATGAMVAGPVVALRLARGRADLVVEQALPAVLEDAARKVRAGTELGLALVQAGAGPAARGAPRVAHDLARLGRALTRGESLSAALDAWAGACPLPGVRLAAAAVALAAEQGGAQARAMAAAAGTLQERLDRAGEVRAATAQARASVVVLGAAPLAFAVLAVLLDPSTARGALGAPAGLVAVVAGLALELAGVLWMNRLMGALR